MFTCNLQNFLVFDSNKTDLEKKELQRLQHRAAPLIVGASRRRSAIFYSKTYIGILFKNGLSSNLLHVFTSVSIAPKFSRFMCKNWFIFTSPAIAGFALIKTNFFFIIIPRLLDQNFGINFAYLCVAHLTLQFQICFKYTSLQKSRCLCIIGYWTELLVLTFILLFCFEIVYFIFFLKMCIYIFVCI